MTLRIVAISDTHQQHRALTIPDGDVLVHAGDITALGEIETLHDFNDFLDSLPHKHKLVIAGNHDFCLERQPQATKEILTNCTYLLDQEIIINGVKFWGSPWQPTFHNWAFNLDRGRQLREKWKLIPADTDVLITHGPPHKQLDYTITNEHVGCADLLEIVEQITPKLHIFGHIHEQAGTVSNGQTTFVNASSINLSYQPINPPLVFDI